MVGGATITVGKTIRRVLRWKSAEGRVLCVCCWFIYSTVMSSQDPFLHSVRSPNLLSNLVRPSIRAREGRLVPHLLLSLPVDADGEWLESTQPGTLSCLSAPFLTTRLPWQCFHVPYSALTMFISSNQKERDSATAYRTSTPPPPPCGHMALPVCCYLGTDGLLCVVARYDGGGAGHSAWHGNPGTDRRWQLRLSRRCSQCERDQGQCKQCVTGGDGECFRSVTQQQHVLIMITRYCLLCPQKQAYLVASGVICIIYVACAAVLFFGVKERKGANSQRNGFSFYP